MKSSINDRKHIFPNYKIIPRNYNNELVISSKIKVYRKAGTGKLVQMFLLDVINKFDPSKSGNTQEEMDTQFSICRRYIREYKIPDISTKEITKNERLTLEYIGEDILENFY